jgi:serine/threonine-protein kinase HipA
LTLSDGPAGEHSLAVAGEGRNPDHRHILKVAADASIPKGESETIFEQVKSAVDKWPEYAEAAALSDRRTSEVNDLLN